MTIEILVPDLPESVADATVATWHKKVGETVKRDEVLVEIETEASINGKPQDGFATIEADIIAEAQYAFQDTVPEKAPQPGA